MRILHLITTIDRGGAENQLLMLSRQQNLMGHQVTILYLKGSGELKSDFERHGIKVIEDFSNTSFLIQCIRVRRWLSTQKFEIINSHLPRAEIFNRVVSADIPYVCTRHNSESFFPKYPGRISKLLSHFSLGNAIACISISKSVLEFLVLKNEIPYNVVKPVVHYGIKINKSIVLARSPNPREFRILCVARLVPQKDLETLLKGFAAFAKDYKSTRLTIVGKGREEKRLKLISKELGVGELIDWVESSNDVSSLMKRSSCLVLSSKYEGFGLVLLEAMNAGLPIIASKIPTSIEILGEQYPGLFDVGDFEGLSNLLRKFRLLRMRTRSVDLEKKVIADYSIEKCAEETLRVYEASIN